MVPMERMSFLQSSFGFWVQVNNGGCLVCQRATAGMGIVSTERSQCHRTAPMDLPAGLGHVWDTVWKQQCCSSWGPADVALQRIG